MSDGLALELRAAAERLCKRELGDFQGPTGDDADMRAAIMLARHYQRQAEISRLQSELDVAESDRRRGWKERDEFSRKIVEISTAAGCVNGETLFTGSEVLKLGDDAVAQLATLRSQLTAVQGALADAGTVLAERTDGDYGASVRALTAERDELRAAFNHAIECVDIAFQTRSDGPPPILPDFVPIGTCKFKAVVKLAKEVAALRQQLAAAEAERGRLREACQKWSDAWEVVRDAVLYGRGPLAESEATGYEPNDVLAVIDDAFPVGAVTAWLGDAAALTPQPPRTFTGDGKPLESTRGTAEFPLSDNAQAEESRKGGTAEFPLD